MTGPARVALYYAPRSDDPLALAGASWLGRDADRNIRLAQPALTDIDSITADPRRYGFHATLKPPMRLAPDKTWFAFLAAGRQLASSIAPFALPPLHVAELHGFIALRETTPSPPLQALCDRCVAELDEFRVPPDAAELQRRRHAKLTAAQDAMLLRWGYPYVFETWFFHMTLTRRLDAAERDRIKPVAQAHFTEAAGIPRLVSDVCVFTQASREADFVIAERLPLRG
jgi:putative phosphonate metabolism protein